MDRCARANRALLMSFCGLFIATPIWAEPQDDPFQGDQLQADEPQMAQRSHKPKPIVHHFDPAAQIRHRMRDQMNSGLVGIVSEGTDETVDMALALSAPAVHEPLRLLPIAGSGASQNAEDVMLTRGIDFGIVQTDVLNEIKRNPPFPDVEKYLQYITKLYDRQVQILAGPDIQSIDDLNGKKVNFGLRDSGTYTTATTIFKALGIEPEMTNLPPPLALDKLRRGDISALVYVATKPSRLFQDIRPEENLHFLPIAGNLPTNYTAVTLTSDDYPELVAKDTPVRTVEVGTILVAYNWPANSERYQRVNHFVQAFFAHINDIQASHPKWQQFDVTASVSGWTRFAPAVQWLKKAGLTSAESQTTVAHLDMKQRDSLFKDFAQREALLAPRASQTTLAHLDMKQRDALFKDFAERETLFREFAAYRNEHRQTIVAYDNH